MTAVMKKLGVVLVCLSVFVGATGAYFSYFRSTEEQQIATGTLLFTLMADDSTSLGGWLPGESKTLEYSLTNTGTIPFEAKGYLAGAWDSEGLDPAMVSVLSVEQLSGSSWVPLSSNPTPVGQEFELREGAGQNMLTINPGDLLRLRVRVQLEPTAGNGYQSALFTSSLHVAARQVVTGAEWPSDY